LSTVALLGSPPPSLLVEPKGIRDSAWAEAVDLLAAFGLELDEWQELYMQVSLSERTDGKWAAKTVGLSAPRQNGKSQLIVARALAGVLLFGEKKVVISAHQQDTARETFGKFMDLIEDSPALEKQLRGGSIDKGVLQAVMREQITFTPLDGGSPAKILFKARTKAGNRGFSSDLLFVDEAQRLDPAAWVSINSTMSARPNPQIHLMGTPPTPEDQGETFTKIRDTAKSGNSTSLAWLEWSASEDDDPALEETRRKANPAWDTRINHDVVQGEFESYSPDEFAVDRLGIWLTGGSKPRVIDRKAWDAAAIPASAVPADGTVAYGVKFSPAGDRYGVGVALLSDDVVHVEALPPQPMGAGTSQLAEWLVDRWRDCAAIVIDGKSGAQDFYNVLRRKGVPASRLVLAASDKAIAANAMLARKVADGSLTHLAVGQEGLDESVRNAAKRDIGAFGGWGFEPAVPGADMLPVESVALAALGTSLKKKISTGAAGNGRAPRERRTSNGRAPRERRVAVNA
jgi:hypothetical protein